ncbi:hypothetical protein [Tautonia plasticadhaerens]|uniref:Uncharacterized protein n=1 Tax=Tautonia plasticadhaerens TaxID=2527974 RepID=A0A518H5U3_9BACT|nr:hypothetical protein [Tautonia plasticadhaerens]QDV36206.1 hypothetical protein ElP_41240 [Tautonia plasticadhaerens]
MDIETGLPEPNGKAKRTPRPDQPTTVATGRAPAVLRPWLRAQAVNIARHTAALRPFRTGEFGTAPSAPSDPHLEAANGLISSLRAGLKRLSRGVAQAASDAGRDPTPARLRRLVILKERAHDRVRSTERIWDFYFELFGQRQSQYGPWLLGCDRIALDCYRYSYLGLGTARSIPAPPPFSYMRTGFSPATFRRGIPLRRLGKQLNPFPLVQLPYHRLVNPWTLGAVLHEVSHNLQNDLGLAEAIPRALARRLMDAGCGPMVAATWTRWNREIFADLAGLLLGGPAVVGSLLDVIGRSPAAVLGFNPRGPHPTPYLRALISTELLLRMGFVDEARGYRRAWMRIYPNPSAGGLPRALLSSFAEVNALVVDTVCYRPYPSLGGKSLAAVIRFEAKEQQMIEEAAGRLAAGTDPGVVPERFLIGAARVALDRRLARPSLITENFYKELTRR